MSESSRLRSNDRHEYVDEIVTAVVLQGRACVISVGPLREALRSRPDLRVDSWRLATETDTRVTPAGERPTLGAKIGRIISRSKYSADAVAVRRRIERSVELASAKTDRSFERCPRTLDLEQLVCDSHEHDVGRLTHNDVFCVHAVDRTARCGDRQAAITTACASVLSRDRP